MGHTPTTQPQFVCELTLSSISKMSAVEAKGIMQTNVGSFVPGNLTQLELTMSVSSDGIPITPCKSLYLLFEILD